MAVGKSGYLEITCMPQSVGKVRIYWREDYNVEGNYSTVTVTDIKGHLWHKSAWAYLSVSLKAGDVTVLPNTNGAWKFSANSDTTYRSVCKASNETAWVPVTSGPIYHDNNGTKTITLTLTLHDIICYDYNGTNGLVATEKVTLTPLPRKSSMRVMGTEINSPVNIAITSAADTFTHTLKYSFEGASGTIVEKTEETAIDWTPPLELCKQLPDSTSGVCTIACDTYSAEGTLIGTVSAETTLKVPDDVMPTVNSGWVTVAPYNDNANVQGMGVYLQGYSNAEVTFHPDKIDMSTAYGATIKEYSISCGGSSVTVAPYITQLLKSAGVVSITCKATDSRGRQVSETVEITVIGYIHPTLSEVTVFRCKSDGSASDDGTYISVTAKAGYSSISGKNSATLTVKIGDLDEVSLKSGETKVLGNGGINLKTTYQVLIAVTDTVGNTATYSTYVSTQDVFFQGRIGGKGAAFGKYAETDDLLDVDWNLRGRKDLMIDGAASVGGDVTVKGNATISGAASFGDAKKTRENLDAVPTTRKINNKPLSEDITLDAATVGAVPTARTFNGKSLSADAADADYVVRQGTSDFWTFREWDSGIAECWGTTPVVECACNLEWGTLYYCAVAAGHQYPVDFIAIPVVTATPANSDFDWFLGHDSPGTIDTSPSYFALRPKTGTFNGAVNLYAIGRWK